MPLPTRGGGRHRVPHLLAGFSASDGAAGRMSCRGGKQDAAALEGHPVPPLRGFARRRTRLGRALGLATAMMFLLVPAASAEPPANDDFANREVLSGSLPIEVSRSNVEATKESGEFIPSGPAPAGHSIWFEWEAQGTGWVTIGACDDAFPTILAIFTGIELEHLTPVVTGNANEGPDCPYSQRQYTFKAIDGTTYVIAVDGNIFHMPEAPTPVTEGEVILRIEETSPPLNDDFADATTLEAPIDEEPGGSRFYFAHSQGHNWKATMETGEPFYGTGSGASVWYSWTAPESGKYLFGGPCCGSGLNWSLYAGSSIGELTQILAATGSAEVMVTQGTTFRIAVWGTPDLTTGEPAMGSFSFFISAQLPPLPQTSSTKGDSSPPASSSPDLTPPDTRIRKSALKRMPPIWILHFSSTEPGSTFECKLDKRPFAKCGSSKTFKHAKPGRHTLKVRAVDPSGNVDPSPAVAHFAVRGKAPGKR
jgi:hypothetical protein